MHRVVPVGKINDDFNGDLTVTIFIFNRRPTLSTIENGLYGYVSET